MKSLNRLLNELVRYAADEDILDPADREYAINGLLYLFGLETFTEEAVDTPVDFFAVVEPLLDHAVKRGRIASDHEALRDAFEAKMMDCLMPRPAEIDRRFAASQAWHDASYEATAWFYRLSQATNYIKTARIAKNIHYVYSGKYAPLDITINLSKPEKDPKGIALAQLRQEESYPKCALCMENVGFFGNLDKAPRANHRVVSLTLRGETDAWGFQYSPYSYFNEHCIVLRKEHVPMRVDRTTFEELVDFIDQFPHYLIGSNAGLPIVGGSILTHYHFQGGNYVFPIESARTFAQFSAQGVRIELLDWPLSVVRISGRSARKTIDAVDRLFTAWQSHTDVERDILAESDGEPHNTVTPIVRRTEGTTVFYVVLRNNRATPERPYGLFHPRDEYFHIKKENIGLIEVMGLAVLPGRLKTEFDRIRDGVLKGEDLAGIPELAKHLPWLATLRLAGLDAEALDARLQDEAGAVFEKVLEDCGVYKADARAEFERFVRSAFGK